ncbi:hypothetical protein BGZ68_002226 [Mortierella alpina]|nr:hypothetical protein BGZ68_002226 [Mortierella alpina]
MEETQFFRLAGSTEIVKVPIQQENGQNVVYWESIEQVFPGVKCVKNGDVVVPPCINHFPGVVLGIVAPNADEYLQAGPSVRAPSQVPTVDLTPALRVGRADVPGDRSSYPSSKEKLVEDLQVTYATAEMSIGDVAARCLSAGLSVSPLSPSSKLETPSKTALQFIEALKRASKKAKESDDQVGQQELSAKMAHMIKLQEASDARQEEMNRLQRQVLHHQEEMKQLQRASDAKQEKMNRLQQQALDQQEEMKQLTLAHHEEIKQLQIQALGQLAVLQDRVKAVLTQRYELHEYPIPRLFIVLPQEPSRRDTLDPFANKFRLYFLCECGGHTKSTNSQSKIPHHIHIAMHEGYEIKRPSEFFQQYGAYVLTILKMLKFGITVAGVAIPALPFLISADSMGQVATSVKHWQENIELGVDRAIDHIDNALTHDDGAVVQMENKEALEGADLRKLDTFLKTQDGDKVLGNLYRTVTDEGHVKWVCIDHYRENYLESTAKDFQRTLDTVGGSFDKSLGRVEVALRSRVFAEQFFSALGKARSVYELDIVFDWACGTSDLEQLEVALKKSRVAVLRLGIQ